MNEKLGTPAEIVEVRTRTGATGDIFQVKCKIMDGPDKGGCENPECQGAYPEGRCLDAHGDRARSQRNQGAPVVKRSEAK